MKININLSKRKVVHIVSYTPTVLLLNKIIFAVEIIDGDRIYKGWTATASVMENLKSPEHYIIDTKEFKMFDANTGELVQ